MAMIIDSLCYKDTLFREMCITEMTTFCINIQIRRFGVWWELG